MQCLRFGIIGPLLSSFMEFFVLFGGYVPHEVLEINRVHARFLWRILVLLVNFERQLLSIRSLVLVDDVKARHGLQGVRLRLLLLFLFVLDNYVCLLQSELLVCVNKCLLGYFDLLFLFLNNQLLVYNLLLILKHLLCLLLQIVFG